MLSEVDRRSDEYMRHASPDFARTVDSITKVALESFNSMAYIPDWSGKEGTGLAKKARFWRAERHQP
jgi:hypothetical protein